MHRTTFILASLVAVAFGAVGCSSSTSSSGGSSGSSSGPPCDLSKSVSFQTDIVPIIQNSCSLTSSCHGNMGTMSENLVLGPNLTNAPNGFSSTQAQDSINAIVGVPAKENPEMKLVTAGDPANSFLWHKILGDMNSNSAVAAGCKTTDESCAGCSAAEPCGKQMPYLSGTLMPDDQCAFERWIKQGAMNN